MPSAVSAVAGSLVGAAASRLKTATALQNEAVSRRNRTVDDIRSLMVTGNGKRAIKLMNEWNKTFPDYFIELPKGDELLNTYNARTAKKADIPVELLK